MRELVPRARGGGARGSFHRDCCNSIVVTRDARIGNVTNHETSVRKVWLPLPGRSGCDLHESYPDRPGVSLDSGPRNEEFNDIVDVHVGHVDAPRVAVPLLF